MLALFNSLCHPMTWVFISCNVLPAVSDCSFAFHQKKMESAKLRSDNIIPTSIDLPYQKLTKSKATISGMR